MDGTDTYLKSCDVNKFPSAPPITDANKNWTATFTGVPASNGQVPLTATGDMGGCDRVWITVSASPPPAAPVGAAGDGSCIKLNQADTCSVVPAGGLKRLPMLKTIMVQRRNPRDPDGFALQLKFQGTAKAPEFRVGGQFLVAEDKIKDCSVGHHKPKKIVNQPDGRWYAVFEDVPPSDYDLTATANSGATDTVRVRIEATP